MSAEVTTEKIYLKIVNHRLEMACVGDIVQAGVVISNSEVGLGAVSVQPMIYTLACTNGMITPTYGERRTHVGRSVKCKPKILLSRLLYSGSLQRRHINL